MNDSQQSKFAQGLRQEAQAVEFGRLSKSQVEAARDLVDALYSAYHEKQVRRVQDNRRNHILMISGGKGSGKTTLVLSLRRWFDNAKRLLAESEGRKLSGFCLTGHEQEEYQKLANHIHSQIETCENVKWLDALSLDPMLQGTNLVAAIFARITEAAARHSDKKKSSPDQGLLDPVSLEERALHELGSLRSDAVMALEGNLDERAPGMDPESYAITAIENEKKKMEVPNRLNSVLRHLVEGSTRGSDEAIPGLYVLPIDDIDSAPGRAVEMLKLAYSLSIPRLVFVVLGSAEMADQLLFYQVQGELIQLLRAEEHVDSESIEAITASANEIASSSLRKMIPPSQRIQLGTLTLEHARRFGAFKTDELSTDDHSLQARLTKLEFRAQIFYSNTPGAQERVPPLTGLYSLLFALDPFDQSANFYDGHGLLQTAPRQLSDLYNLVDRAAKTAQNNTQLIHDLFTQAFRPLVDEDGQLTPPVQSALKQCLQLDQFSESIELTPPGLRVITQTGDRLDLEIAPFSVRQTSLYPSCQIVARRVRSLEIEAAGPGGKPRRLAESTRSTFKVIHDLTRLTGAGVLTAPVPHGDRCELAFTRWDDGVNDPFEIPWLQVDWQTFWHSDLFFRLWNRGLWKIRLICRDKAHLRSNDFGYLLALTTAAALVATATAQARNVLLDWDLKENLEGLFGSSVKNPSDSWSYDHLKIDDALDVVSKSALALAEHVEKKRTDGEDDDEADQIDAVLVNLVLLMAPETGIPQLQNRPRFHEGFEALLKNPYVEEKLKRKIRKARLDRLGPKASTLLGMAFLNPRLTQIIVEKKSVEPGTCLAIQEIQNHFPYFGRNEVYCPNDDDLRQAFLRSERTRVQGGLAQKDLEILRDYFVGKGLARDGCPEQTGSNPKLKATGEPDASAKGD